MKLKSFFVFIFLLLTISCGVNIEDRIVGIWFNFDEEEGYTFTEKGTVTFGKDEKMVSGHWELTDDEGEPAVFMEFYDFTEILLWPSFRGDNLIFYNPIDETTVKYQRLQ